MIQPPPFFRQFSFLKSGFQVVSLGDAGGFSGSQIWRIKTPQQDYCLKKWPTSYPSRERLIFIHRVLQHVSNQGLRQIAVPFPNDHGQTVIEFDEALFELSLWLPGEADYEQRPSESKLVAAMSSLGQFHMLASTFATVTVAPSPGIIDRAQQLARLASGELREISAAIQPFDWPQLDLLAREFLRLLPPVIPRLQYDLDRAVTWKVPLQPCIRDIWHDHVLFTEDQVSGLIDFGSLRVENVAGDVARLAGSLVADNIEQRQIAFTAYEQVRRLSTEERELVAVFDQSGTVLGGINWLRWIFCEQRQFADRARVEYRFRFLLSRLQHLAQRAVT